VVAFWMRLGDPILFKDMFPIKLQTNTVNFNGTPGMGLDQVGKILFSFFQGQLIGATIKMFTDSAHSARVGLNGLLTFALQLEQSQVTLIKFVKSVCFGLIHGISPFGLKVPGIGSRRRLYNDSKFFSAA
jgi:hypothetical protein